MTEQSAMEPTLAGLRLMDRYGGSFAKGLADLYFKADPVNRAILIHGFRDLFDAYDRDAQMIEKGRQQGIY